MSQGCTDGLLSMSAQTGKDQAESAQSMGCSEHALGQEPAISQVDAAYITALHRIADSIELLARATAGEFDQDDDHDGISRPTDISGRPI